MFQWMITRVLNVTCLLIWTLCVRVSLPDVSHVIFHFLPCNCFLSLPQICFFPPPAHFSLFCSMFLFPNAPIPLRKIYLCVRGVKHTPRNGKIVQSRQHLPLPCLQALLFRSQREGPGVSLSNITSNRDSQIFSLMTSGNETSVLETHQ